MSETARKAEANDTEVSFEFRGESFVIPTEYDDYPLAFIEAAADGRPLAIQVRELLGPDQWERVREMRLNGRELNDLSDAMTAAAGLSSGNSRASSD